jgi:hypothetical protein
MTFVTMAHLKSKAPGGIYGAILNSTVYATAVNNVAETATRGRRRCDLIRNMLGISERAIILNEKGGALCGNTDKNLSAFSSLLWTKQWSVTVQLAISK